MSQKRFFVRMQTRRGGGRDRRPRGARASRWALESLEPRLLLSSAPLDPLAVDLTEDPALAPAPVAAPPEEAGARSPAAQLVPDAIGPLAAEAIHRLSLAGVDPESVARLHDIEIQVVDLPGWTVATTTGTGIALDREAAGRGWFLDPTPADDAEFTVDGARLAAGEGPAGEGIDLLTVLSHEFGHQLGLDHAPIGEGTSALDALMERGIRPGVRRIEAMPGPSGDGLVPLVPAGTPRIGDALEIAETIRWNTDASGFWDVASNWIDTATLQARTPTASDDVRIDRGAANPVVTVRTATAAAHHVLAAESVVVAGGGTLDLSGTLSSTGSTEVSGGGTLRRAAIEAGTTVTVTVTGGTLNGVTVAGTVLAPTQNLVVTGGMNLETGALFQIGAMSSGSAAIARFNGDQTIGGPGEIRLVGPGRASMIVNGNLTIAAGTAIDGPSGDITIQGGTLINRGTIGPSAGGSLNLGLAGATQNWTNEAGGRLVASGGALGLGGAWSNAGEIAVGAAAGSALFLGGTFTTAGLGTLLRDGTAANSISLTGTLDNTGATVTLDATTGSWFLQGGTVKGGTLRTLGGAQLLDTTAGGLLTGITLDGSVMLVRGAIAGGLTLAPGALVQIGGVLASGNFLHGDVSLSGDQTIGGTGEIRFAGARGGAVSRLRVGGNTVLDTGVTVAGQAGDVIITGSLTNRGLIAPAGGDFVIGFAGQSWTNAAGGRLRADGGVLVLGGNWSNAGEIAVGAAAGSALYLGGSFTTGGIGTIARQGTAGNSVNIIGLLDNTGATLALDDTTGSWVLLTNGTLRGGTVTTTAGAPLIAGGGVLDGVALDGTILVTSQTAVVTGGLTLAPGSLFQIGGTVGGTFFRGILTFSGDQTIGGTGEVRLAGTDAAAVIPGNLVLGPGITVTGQAGAFNIGGSLTNQGTIQATGGTFTFGVNVGVGTFANAGSMLFTNAAVTLGAGNIRFEAGSTFRNTGGLTLLRGTLDNTGRTLTIDDTLGAFFPADGGTIRGGTIVTTGTQSVQVFHGAGILDGVVLKGTVDLSVAGSNAVTVRFLNGLTLDGGLIRLGLGGTVNFAGTQTLGGTGTVVFTDSNAGNAVLVPTAGTTLTIGPGITVRGATGKIDATNATFVNQGTVAADGGGTVTVIGAGNAAGGVLTGGRWQAIGASTLRFLNALITSNAADILLDGPAARLLADGSAAPTHPALAANTAAGTLTLRNGARLGTAADFANAGAVTVAGGAALVQDMGQFASSVLGFSSQATTSNWSAAQTLGPPNTAGYGNFTTAWAPLAQNGGLQFVTVGFLTPVFATGVTVRETWGNGFVVQVDAIDTADVSHTVWTGVDPSLPGTPVEFTPTWAPTPYMVKAVTITIDTNHNPGTWEEIDSIELHGFAATGSYRQTAGTTALDGGRLAFTDAVDVQGGVLTGPGTIEADVVNAAVVDPGASTGALAVSGRYTQMPGGILAIDLGGTAPGTQHDRLAVAGAASLAGTLDIDLVNGFGPAAGQTFEVLTYASATGAFDTVDGLTAGFKPLFTLDQGATEVTLTSVANAADLAFGSMAIPAAGSPGQDLTVSYTVSNEQESPVTGEWVDSVYLSASPVMDETALLLGRVQRAGPVAGGGTYTGTLTAAVPALRSGAYHVIVLVDSRGSIADLDRANNTGKSATTLAVTVPLLQIGTTVEGTIASGQDRYYRLVVPPGQDVDVTASFGAVTQAEMYLRHGDLPDRSTFDQAAAELTEIQPKLSVANAQGGDYYVLLHGREGAGTGGAFTLRADLSAFAITRFTPDAGSNEGTTTVTVTGTRFTEETAVALTDVRGDVFATADVRFVDSQRLHATFDLEGVPEGFFNLRATDHGQTVTAADLFEVGTGTGGFVSVSILAPAAVRVGEPIPITIKVINASGSNGIAPIIEVRASNVAENQKTKQFFASDGENLPGTLPPGADIDLGIVYDPRPHAVGITSGFELVVANPSGIIMDWDSQKENYRPSHVSPAAWDAVWANFRPRVGSTLAHFYSLLLDDARALARYGELTTEVHDLLRFEFQKAANDLPSLPGASAVDLGLASTGMRLVYSRTAGTSIFDRYHLGRLGYGWTDNFDVSATTDADGLVAIQAAGLVRFFGRLDNGTYLAFPGELGTLSSAGGALQLRETDGSLITFRPDGKVDYFQDPNGNRIVATYSGGRLARVTHSDGAELTFAYNAAGFVSQATDSVGRTATYGYDAAGHLTSVTTAAGTTTYTYTTPTMGAQAHALASITSPSGTHAFIQYDSQGRLARQEGDGGAEAVTYIYGQNGYSMTDALGRTGTVFFDHLGRRVASIDPLGRTTRLRYDEAGNLTAFGPASGGTGSAAHDEQGNPTAGVNALGETLAFTYESGGVTGWTDARGNATAFTTDSRGNVQAITYADGSAKRFEYDGQGKVIRSVSRAGLAVSYTYDEDGLLTRKTFADGTRVDYAHDAHRNVISATDAAGTTTLEYDAADRVTKVTYPSGRFLRYTYDAGGRVAQIADQSGFAERYAYDTAGRLATVSDAGGNLIVRYGYDAAGQLVREDKGNGTATTYEYDLVGQLRHLVHLRPDGSVSARFDYTYDDRGRRTEVAGLDGITTYRYDAVGRLTGVTLPDAREIAYAYDAAGNRVSVTDGSATTAYTTNALNQYTAVGGGAYVYDLDGNLISGGGNTYTYDARGRLTGVTGIDGTWTYRYDALGNRIAAIRDGQTTEYLVDPGGLGTVFGEYDGSGALVANYVLGVGLEGRADPSGQLAYYDFDATGNTAQLTGAGGAVLNRYRYLPFGEALAEEESVANPFEYGGQFGVAEEGGGLLHMRNRSYDPATGRFTRPDPVGVAGGANLYAYVKNAPVSFVDPAGLNPALAGAAMISELATTISPIATTIPGAALAATVPGAAFAATVPAAAISPLATTMTGAVISPMATTMAGTALSPLASTIPGAALAATVPGPAFALTIPGSALNPWATPVGHIGGFTQAEFQAGIEAAEAILAQRALAAAATDASIGMGIEAAAVVGVAIAGWSASSLISAMIWGQFHNGHLPPCPVDDPGSAGWLLNAITACDSGPIPPGSALARVFVRQVGPHDPNELFGPGGFGPEQFIRPEGIFPYIVYFQNDPEATAPAQNVVVTEQMDPDLDWTTLELGDFGFGDVVVDVPEGRQFYTTRLDQRATLGVFVDATAEFNAATGLLTWTFLSLDPATLDTPANPLVGFLPPDNDEHVGQGFGTYFVAPRGDTPTGSVIEALATIVFDTEAPIDTPLWSNAIDAGGPASNVQALAATTVGPDFTVSWTGADDAGGSGIGAYDVFVSADGGAFTAWLTGTTETAATFTGEIGRTYAFYSVATDNVGHREADPGEPDATTRVVAVQENQAPVLGAIGDRTVAEGEELVIVVGATDADVPPQALTFDATGLPEGATFDPATRTFRWTPSEAQGPGLFEGITFSVSDGTDTDSETISIEVGEINAAPVAELTGPTGGVRGQPLAFTGAFSDADVPDAHEVAVDWGDGTGTAFHPATDPGALDLTHVYTGTGTFTVTWSVRDEDGEVGTVSRPVVIEAVQLQPDPVEPGKTALVVGGTTGNDVIKFSKDRSGGVKVVLNKVTLGVFAPTGRVVAFGQAGNDDISVGATVLLPVEFHGGEGNDKLKAGKMGSILVGGPGNDKLTGGAGRDLLIGGEGADTLSGSGGDDILIGGRTAYDDQPDALRAIMAEWTRTDAGYAERVERLRTGGDGGGRNGTVLLNAETVLDDGVKDALTGGPGLDWFFAGILDKVTGRAATEVLTAERPPSALAIAWGPVAAGLERDPFRSEEPGTPTVPEFTIEIGADAAEDVEEDPLLALV